MLGLIGLFGNCVLDQFDDICRLGIVIFIVLDLVINAANGHGQRIFDGFFDNTENLISVCEAAVIPGADVVLGLIGLFGNRVLDQFDDVCRLGIVIFIIFDLVIHTADSHGQRIFDGFFCDTENRISVCKAIVIPGADVVGGLIGQSRNGLLDLFDHVGQGLFGILTIRNLIVDTVNRHHERIDRGNILALQIVVGGAENEIIEIPNRFKMCGLRKLIGVKQALDVRQVFRIGQRIVKMVGNGFELALEVKFKAVFNGGIANRNLAISAEREGVKIPDRFMVIAILVGSTDLVADSLFDRVKRILNSIKYTARRLTVLIVKG